MGLFQSLSVVALRQVAVGATRAAGLAGAESVARFLGDHFSNNSDRLGPALRIANERAWNALEIALAGESLWQKLDNAEDRAFRTQVRVFLDAAPLTELADRGDFRRQCLRELRDARKSGLLLSGGIEASELARQASELAHLGDATSLLAREWQALDSTANELRRAGHAALAELVALRPGEDKPPLLAVAVRFYFRRAVETDAELHRGLSFAQWQALAENQQQGFEQLGAALDVQGDRLNGLLDDVGVIREVVLDLRQEIAGQREQIQQLAQDVLKVLDQHQLARRELRVGDSLSLRTDEERRLVKSLVARYRELPSDQRQEMPALLNAVGKMEVVAGNFDAARRDFEELVRLIPGDRAKAEAFYNAYQAALESRQWDVALTALRDAVALDAERFAPFPQNKYEAQRILGAGGFGVAFLCRDRHTGSRVVVKVLRADGLDRAMTEVFAEARALEDLDHENIIRLRHCDYAGPNNTRPYLVMDYFESATLAEHVALKGPLSVAEATPLLAAVARALHKAHEKGVCHRDVKPGNLLVRRVPGEPGASATGGFGEPGALATGVWQIKLIDFGLALRHQTVQSTLGAAASHTQTLIGSSIAGTLDYAAPEQLGKRPGDKVGPHSDVYGLGKTACFALFGTTLPLARHWRSVSPELADLLGQCLADDPKERPASCREVAERLVGTPVVQPPVAVPVAAPVAAPPVAAAIQPSLDPRPHFIVGGILGLVASIFATFQPVWFNQGLTLILLALTAALAAGIAATTARRWHPLSTDPPVRGLRRVGILAVFAVMLVGLGLAGSAGGYVSSGQPTRDFFMIVSTIVSTWGLGYVWGRLFGQTFGAMVTLGALVLLGILVHQWWFLFAGAMLAATAAAAFEVAPPLRLADRHLDQFFSGLLVPLATAFARGTPARKQSEPAPPQPPAEPERPRSSFGLVLRAGMLLIACAVFAGALGLNAGATGFLRHQGPHMTLVIALVLATGWATLSALTLSRGGSFWSLLRWALVGVFVCCWLAALTAGLGWITLESPLVVLLGLGVVGTVLGLLCGLRLGCPIRGALTGGVLSGLVVLQGWLLGHPDPAALFAVPFGLLAGTLLWSGLRNRPLWWTRGVLMGACLAAFIVAVTVRDAVGLFATTPPPELRTRLGGGYSSYWNPGPVPALAPTGERLLLLSGGGVQYLDLATGKHLDTFARDHRTILALGYYYEQPLCLATTSYTNGLGLFNVETGKALGNALPQVTGEWLGATDGEYFLAVSAQQYGASVSFHFFHGSGSRQDTYQLALPQRVTAVALQGQVILLGLDDGTVALVKKNVLGELQLVEQTKKLSQRVRRLAISGDGGTACAVNERQFMVWSVEGWKDFFVSPPSNASPTCAALEESGERLLIGTQRGQVQVWDVKTREVKRTYNPARSLLLGFSASVEQIALLDDSNGRSQAVAVVEGVPVRWTLGNQWVTTTWRGVSWRGGDFWNRPKATTKPADKVP